jgi:hypothetical protein
MSKQYDNNLSGVLYVNDRQRAGKKDPDRQGSCEIDGVEYWISGWFHDGRKGKFLSLAFQRKDKKGDDRPLGPQTTNDPDW